MRWALSSLGRAHHPADGEEHKEGIGEMERGPITPRLRRVLRHIAELHLGCPDEPLKDDEDERGERCAAKERALWRDTPRGDHERDGEDADERRGHPMCELD